MSVFLTALAAFGLDCAVGDPRSKYHPVVLVGNAIAFLDKCLRDNAQSPLRQMRAGGVLVALVLCGVYVLAEALLAAAAFVDERLTWLLSALLLYATISPRSLAEAGLEIRSYLLGGNLAEARRKVGWIVGRDTDQLSVPEITRATVETIAENIVDGVVSPLFFFCLGGAPLAVLYRAVNTMDSMLGYKNDKYLYFGRVAARTDDVCNYVPARLTALLLIVAAFLLRFDWRGALRMIRRDAAKHPSPNSGFTEAGVAGALGVQLGGLNYYFGQPSLRARMGDATRALEPEDIARAVWLMYGATGLFLLAMGAAYGVGGYV